MRAKLKGIHSSDIDDLQKWSPGHHFGAVVDILIGPSEGHGKEIFQLTICSPSWFTEQIARDEIRSGHHTLFMQEYDYRRLHAFIERAVQRAEATTWQELATKLSWLGHWEFENYIPESQDSRA